MQKIGLTGGIGSGKSLIAEIFHQKYNIPVFKADDEAKELMQRNRELKENIIKLLGPKSYENGGKLNRNWIAKKVFNQNTLLEKLNQLVHTKVREQFSEWLQHKNKPYVIQEAAILIESGGFKNMDAIIAVTAPEELRIKRVKNRDKMSKEQILQRMVKQLSDEERNKYAHFTINNDNAHSLIAQIETIHKKIIANG